MELFRRLRPPTASLPTKLIVALSALVTVVVAGSAMFLVAREREARLYQLEARATSIADLLAQSLAQELSAGDSKTIQRALDALVPIRELAEVTVTAVGPGTVATVAPRRVSDPRSAIVRMRPITYRQFEGSPGQTIGEVRVVLSRADAQAAFARAWWAIFAMATAVVLILYAATTVLVRRFVRTPIARLETMVDRLATGDLDARCPVDSADELGRLAERVNVMADRLRDSTTGLRESEMRFRTFVDHATDAFFLHDDHLAVIDVNRQACESLGYSRDELIGMHPRDFDVGLDEASVAQLAERVRAGETVTFESLHRRKDGTVFPVEVRAHRFPQGERRLRYSLVRDITARNRAEAELRASEERFRTLVQFSFDVYWETDAQHRFTRQEFAKELSDAPTPGSEIGKTRWEVPYLEPDEEAWRKHRETLDAHLPFLEFELARPMPDGGRRWVSVSGLPMFDSAGRFLGYRGVGRHITERKRVEAELRARQELLDLAQKAARAVAFDWYIGARESENRWSPELEAMYGLEPGAFDRTYQGWKKLIHPDDWPDVKIAIERANESGDVAAEYRVIHKDGTVHWLRAKGRMFFDAKRRPERMVGFMIDVTDSRHAEEALRASEARFRTFVDHATDAFFRFDDNSTVVDVNRQACESLGYSREELIGMHPRDFDAALDASSLAQTIARIGTGETVTFETLHRRKDGHVFPVEIRARQFEEGGRRFRLSLARNISERKRAEAALRRSEAYLAEAQRLTHTGSWAYDVAGESIYWSEEMFGIYGFDPQEGIPTRAQREARVHPDDLERVGKARQKIVHEQADVDLEHRIVLPDGRLRHVHVRGRPVLSATGLVTEMVGTTVDITDRVRAEEQRERLRELEADLAHIQRVSLMGELAASIAHEVNQPLSGVVSNASACLRWLGRDVPNIDEAREAATRIVRDGKRAGEVIARVRALTRKAATAREQVDINETILDVLGLVADEAKRTSTIVRTRFAPDVSPVAGDRVQLQQVMLNLVMNAIEAMSSVPEGPRELVITTRNVDPGQVQVTVEDSGMGLDPSAINKVFEPFYSTKASGMGMGLSICRSILQSHGARLWATGKDGPGTMFHFALPNYSEEAADSRAD